MSKSVEARTRPTVAPKSRPEHAVSKRPQLPPLPTRAKPAMPASRIPAGPNRFFYHSHIKPTQEIQTKASHKPSIVAAGFAAAAVVALLANQLEENETKNKRESSMCYDKLINCLPQTMLRKPFANGMDLETALKQSEKNSMLREMVDEYILSKVIPNLEEEDFDKLAIKIFASDNLDYAKACIKQLKEKFNNIDKDMLVEKVPVTNRRVSEFNVYDTALRIAAHHNHDVFKLVLESGANLQSEEGSRAFRTAANSYSINNLQLLLTSGYKLSDDDIRYVESSLTRFIPEKENARVATAKLLIANGLDPVNPLHSGIFSDFELVQTALPGLKKLGHEPFGPIESIMTKLGGLPQSYPADQQAIELFLDAAVKNGYKFEFPEAFYSFRNAVIRKNEKITHGFLAVFEKHCIDPRELIGVWCTENAEIERLMKERQKMPRQAPAELTSPPRPR